MSAGAMNEDRCPAGLIEGFYGREWSWEDRHAYAAFLKERGFCFYIYAPKGDRVLRKSWQSPWPKAQHDALVRLAAAYKAEGLSFGIGFSPFELYLDDTVEARAALKRKMDEINAIGPDILCILFDDMKGDVPGLAGLQAKLTDEIAALSTASRFIMCPSYYSFDPILEKVFGAMPENYMQDLGRDLDPAFDVFWTGPKVCAPEFTKAHIEEVTEIFSRKPFLWDNYPVNDGARMSRFLHLDAFTGRPGALGPLLAGHAVNPMNQPAASRIPLRTLEESYRLGEAYDPRAAFEQAAFAEAGDSLGRLLIADLEVFQRQGLDKLDAPAMSARYAPFGGTALGKEILDWLAGRYEFDPACLTD